VGMSTGYSCDVLGGGLQISSGWMSSAGSCDMRKGRTSTSGGVAPRGWAGRIERAGGIAGWMGNSGEGADRVCERGRTYERRIGGGWVAPDGPAGWAGKMLRNTEASCGGEIVLHAGERVLRHVAD
jgi:hypothetical protein